MGIREEMLDRLQDGIVRLVWDEIVRASDAGVDFRSALATGMTGALAGAALVAAQEKLCARRDDPYLMVQAYRLAGRILPKLVEAAASVAAGENPGRNR